MSKYNSQTIYRGNLKKKEEKGCSLFEEDVLLIYDEKKDVFYSFTNTLNLFLTRDLNKLTDEQKEEVRKEIAKYTYRYDDSGDLGTIYVDESSLKKFISDDYKKNSKN